ncbi:3-phosphoshikimate 1-carboxyvinyltransferase [Staphylococcus auricularis]|uniref:3-phosphoshikimate 1-carboxyvinyltransferase n=1 Tax=Staphylococcus auricularis TaxID=29379 RepID=UPI003EBA39CB
MNTTETIDLKGPLKGELTVPGDKSMTHRAIILSALAKGTSTIYEPLLGQDCLRTVDIFRTLGVDITIENQKIIVRSPGYQHFKTPHQVLYTGNSGTTTRLLSGVLSGLGIESVISGDASIGTRPMNRVIEPLTLMNADISGIEGNYTPLIIRPSKIKGINHEMKVASAQVKSALLFAGLFADENTVIREKETTRNHTETMLKHYHVPVQVEGNQITLPPKAIQHIKPADFYVPGDISSAAYFIVAALITPDSDITIHNVGINPTRSGIIDIVKQMNGKITLFNASTGEEPTASIRVQYSPHLVGMTIKGELIPRVIDEIPVIALLCTQGNSDTAIHDAEELKIKETNRIDTTAQMLNKLGFKLEPLHDGLHIQPSTLTETTTVDSCTDHRIAMTLAVASLLTTETIDIERFDAVDVSFPGFLNTLKHLTNEGD